MNILHPPFFGLISRDLISFEGKRNLGKENAILQENTAYRNMNLYTRNIMDENRNMAKRNRNMTREARNRKLLEGHAAI